MTLLFWDTLMNVFYLNVGVLIIANGYPQERRPQKILLILGFGG